MRSPSKEDLSPRSIIRRKWKDTVTRRRTEAKANSDTFTGLSTGTRRNKTKKMPTLSTFNEEE
jgi:hypothetical protein